MIMKRRALLALTLIFSILIFTQAQDTIPLKTAVISGKVIDDNNQPLEIVTIRVEGQTTGTVSDLKGNYSLTVESRDSVVIIFSMLGYQTRKRTLRNPQGKITLDVMLPSSDYELEGVTIKEIRSQTGQNVLIDGEQAKLMPTATGNAVEELIATQAGVSSHNELSSQYNVRGGSFDENSVYVNGIEIYRPLLIRSGQQEGLSFINPDMVENISFSSGGFEAKYGDKMSSVLDITYKKPTKLEATTQASLFGAGAYVGFVLPGNFTMMNSIRYKTNSKLVGTMDTKGEYHPKFTDYQTSMNWEPNKRWSLGFIGNYSRNRYNFRPEDRETRFGTMDNIKEFKVFFEGQERDLFQTYFGALSLTRNINNHNSITLQTSAFHTKEEETYDITGEYWLNSDGGEESLGVGTYMEHARNYLNADVQTYALKGKHELQSGHRILWGTEIKREKFKETSREWEMRDSAGYSLPHTNDKLELIYNLNSKNDVSSGRYSAYIQDTYRLMSPAGLWSFNAGIRASYWDWNEELIVSPRVAVGFIPAFNENFTFRFATGLYYQAPFYKEYRDTTVVNGMASVTLNKDIRSQRSIHFVLAGDYKFRVNERPFRFTTEFYYKKLSNLVPYNVDNVKISYYGENLCDGYAAGVDFKLFGEFVPGTDSWITFSVMKTEEKLNGKWIPRPTDQKFNISLFFTDYFPNTDRWRMNLRMNYASGLPFGPPHSGREQYVFRAPAYKRVDLGMSYRMLNNEEKDYRTGMASHFRNVWLGIDVLNLFDIDNINSYYWITDVNNNQFAIPNYLTSRQINVRLLCEF